MSAARTGTNRGKLQPTQTLFGDWIHFSAARLMDRTQESLTANLSWHVANQNVLFQAHYVTFLQISDGVAFELVLTPVFITFHYKCHIDCQPTSSTMEVLETGTRSQLKTSSTPVLVRCLAFGLR